MTKTISRFLVVFTAVLFGLSPLKAERVSETDAALVAGNFMNAANMGGSTYKAPAKRMVLKQASTTTSEENQFYIYENAGGEGWVMVAANDLVRPILAYSETGHFRTENMPVNLTKWLNKYDRFITKLEAEGATAGEETAEEWKMLRKGARTMTAVSAVVGPLVQTKWDQDAPYNNLCPGTGTWGRGSSKAAVGCVATAMAQVMKYWEWPTTGNGSHTYQPLDPNSETGEASQRYGQQTANFGATTYDWANMKNSYQGSYTDAQAKAVATLMYHCGVGTEMMYGNYDDGGSGTYTVNYGDWNDYTCAQSSLAAFFRYRKSSLTGYMRDGYKYQGTVYYDKWTDADWTAMIKEELDNHHPIMYGGASDQGGHSFICDGYDNAGYFHFNWGWSGDCDGYFLLSKLNPGGDGIGGGGYDFSEDQDVIIGIVPDKTNWPKVTVTWSVNGQKTEVEYTQEDPLVLPSEPAACSEDRIFVGWTKQSNVSDKPADLFTKAGKKAAVANVTYYAVFATVEDGAEKEPQEVAAVTFKTSSSDGRSALSDFTSVIESDKGIAAYSGVNAYKGIKGLKLGKSTENGSLTLTLSEEFAVSEVKVNADQYGTDTGKLQVSAGSTTLGDAQAPAANLLFTAAEPVSTNTITIETTSKRAYIGSVSVIATAGTVYKDYSTSCSAQGIEDVQSGAECNKVLRNGQLFIRRGEAVYSITGTRIQ